MAQITFEYYTDDLQGEPLFHAFLEGERTRLRIGCIHAFYRENERDLPQLAGWTFACGSPKLGIPYHTGTLPIVPTSDDAAVQLAEFVNRALAGKNHD